MNTTPSRDICPVSVASSNTSGCNYNNHSPASSARKASASRQHYHPVVLDHVDLSLFPAGSGGQSCFCRSRCADRVLRDARSCRQLSNLGAPVVFHWPHCCAAWRRTGAGAAAGADHRWVRLARGERRSPCSRCCAAPAINRTDATEIAIADPIVQRATRQRYRGQRPLAGCNHEARARKMHIDLADRGIAALDNDLMGARGD